MKSKSGEKRSINLYHVLCLVVVAVTLLPISCNYIMAGGIIEEWIERVREIAEGVGAGRFFFFPSDELLISAGTSGNAMNSNLWFLLPGLLYYISGNVVISYRVYMIAIQMGTAFTAKMFFDRFFGGEEKRVEALFGLMLYMTCPYRIYICYDLANMSQAVVWMLVPLYAWAITGVLSGNKSIKELVVAVATLAGIGYADIKFFLILSGVMLLVGIMKGRLKILISLLGGLVLFCPGWYRLFQYLFMNRFDHLNIPTQLIMRNGYRFGEFFTVHTWKEGHPGMGLGVFASLLIGMWLRFVKKEAHEQAKSRWLLFGTLIAATMASCYFPWDLVQRLGTWALKFVTLMETPAIFWGIACSILSIPGAGYMGQISKNESKLTATVVPVIVILFCIGGCIFQCNTLMYERGPLPLP